MKVDFVTYKKRSTAMTDYTRMPPKRSTKKRVFEIAFPLSAEAECGKGLPKKVAKLVDDIEAAEQLAESLKDSKLSNGNDAKKRSDALKAASEH